MQPEIISPRQARHYINRAEAWYRKNEGRFEPTDQVVIRAMFEEASSPLHAGVLREEIERRLRREPLLKRAHTDDSPEPLAAGAPA